MPESNRIVIGKEKFAIVKSTRFMKGAFANIDDGKEITVIIEQDKIDKKEVIAIEKDYRLITFDMTLEFSLIGFISGISKALADEGIPIFVVSAYSTDHVFIKNEYLDRAVKVLNKLEFKIK